MNEFTNALRVLMEMPMVDLVASLPCEVRKRVMDMAATDQRHAEFLGPELLAILASHEAAEIEAAALMERLSAGPSC